MKEDYMSEETKKVTAETSEVSPSETEAAVDSPQSEPVVSDTPVQQANEVPSTPAEEAPLPSLNDYNQQADAVSVDASSTQADSAYQAPAYQDPAQQEPAYPADNEAYPDQASAQTGAYANAYQLEPEILGETYVRQHSSSWNTLYLIAFIFSVVSTVFCGILILPLAWMIPMTVHLWRIYKGTKDPSTAFSVCTLLFLNFVAGILMLVADSKED